MENELVPMAVLDIDKAVERRRHFKDYVKKMMEKDQDYGTIQGTKTPTLLKPGAEKLMSLYGFVPRFTLLEKIEDWNKPFFFYRYQCDVIWYRSNGTEMTMFTSVASCSSKESKYAGRWVPESELTESQKIAAKNGTLTFDGRDEWQPEFKLTKEQLKQAEAEKWRKEKRKAKSGEKYLWYLVPAVRQYFVPNEKLCDQVNTIDKMAQKRAFVGAAIGATNASDQFTQDLEDNEGSVETAHVEPEIQMNNTTEEKAHQVLDEWRDSIYACNNQGELETLRREVSETLDEAALKWLEPHFQAAILKFKEEEGEAAPAAVNATGEAKFKLMIDAAKDKAALMGVWKAIPDTQKTMMLKQYFTAKQDEFRRAAKA